MKTLKTKHITFLAVLFAFAVSCNTTSQTKESEKEKKQEKVNHNYNIKGNKLCFKQVTPYETEIDGKKITLADTLFLSVTLSKENNSAGGIYYWKPAEKDQLSGTFLGTISNDTVTATYKVYGEGQENLEELIFVLTDKGASVAEGNKILKDSVYVYDEKSKVHFSELIPKVDCK